ncbi:nucleotidyl transferase AbiEii/AbiGii toxin family protein [Desulfovibrio falkowii]|uniref:Nucleotidyl transferase AbiEii/AbiGii toxin family protein n=1 Tax=Desulfovibrio falkowii TaxID=3136602 RepID=A0ABQ0E635_9BACT
MPNDTWKKLFSCAMEQIEQANIPHTSWSFGGGTVLMHKFNHRMSKDIDIFFRDKQLFAYISPRVNDALENETIDFVEQDNFTKIYLQQGEIDFIYSPQITSCIPTLQNINGKDIYVDNPVEIIAKKIYYRAEEFRARDVFDMSLVFFKCKDELLKNCLFSEEKIQTLKKRILELNQSGVLESELSNIATLSGAKEVRGKEILLSQDFFRCLERRFSLKKKSFDAALDL